MSIRSENDMMKRTASYPVALALFLVLSLFHAGTGEGADPPFTAPVGAARIVAEYPHDPGAFTQGLVFHGGFLYEGTGLNGSSSLRKVDLKTGKVLQTTRLADRYFGEGIAILRGKIYQLTWRSRTGFVYDLDGFKQNDAFSYDTEGWGLTTDGRFLIMSDGTDTLQFLHPRTFKIARTLRVRDGGRPVELLNELEYVRGEIFANVLGSDYIACISPRNGAVTRWIDLRKLRERFGGEGADVLNGIAYDRDGDRLFVTGKKWPVLFEIRIGAGPDSNSR